MSKAILTAGFVALSLTCVTPVAAATACDHGCLLGMGDTYINALTWHDTGQLAGVVSADAVMTENGQPTRLGEGLLANIKGFPFRQSFADPVTGQYVLIAVATQADDAPALVAVRLKAVDRKITEIESLFIRKGDHNLFETTQAPGSLPMWSMPLPASAMSKRMQMIAAANEHFETILRGDPKQSYSPDCDRYENGVQTTNNPASRGNLSCTEGGRGYTGAITAVRDRRFPVVDEETGVVVAMGSFDVPGTVEKIHVRGKEIALEGRNRAPRSSLFFEVFKIEYGRIRAIMARLREAPYGAPTGWAGDQQGSKIQ